MRYKATLEPGSPYNSRCFLWALFMVVLGAYAYGGEDVSAKTSKSFEASKIKAGLSKIGVGESYEIIIADECDVVENTAAEMMQRFLAKASLPARIVKESQATGDKRILLGRESNLKAIREFGDSGDINIRDVSAEDDGYHLKQIGKSIVIAGANPRGVLYGVYAFEDFVYAGANGNLDIKKVPYFRKRGSGPSYTDVQFDAKLEDFPEEKAEYLSRLGINQMTDQGISGNLCRFVKSDIFPFQTPPDPEFQRKLKAMFATCKKYGIDIYLFLIEPALVDVPGGIDSYPKEALGTVRPPWGGDKDGLARTLCVSSPLTQQYLREMTKKLIREYPDLDGINFYNLDCGSWLCTPELCERCKKVCSDTSQHEFAPWELQANCFTLLAEAAHEEKPDFDFRLWSSVHFHGERFEKMVHAVQGYNGIMSSWTGSDRSLMVPDAAVRTETCVQSQALAKERGVPFYMMAEFNNFEIVPKSLPYPFHVCDALKKYQQWDVQNIIEIFGSAPEQNPINAITATAFEWNPKQDTAEFLEALSLQQFGKPAGKEMYQAWKEMKDAFDVWNDVKSPPFPLMGSQFHVKMGLSIGGLPPALTPDIAQYYDSLLDTLTRVEPWLAEGYQQHKTQAFLDKMEQMSSHIALAASHAKKAIDKASSEEYIGISSYQGADGRQSCKEYAELNYASITIANVLCKQRCNIVRAYRLLTDMENARAAGDEKTVQEKKKVYDALVREDIVEQEQFCELLTGFSKMQPCYTRTSLTEKEIADLLSTTQGKIKKMQEYLATAPATS